MVISRLPEREINHPKRYMPPEIIEKILLNLPIKSLLRFCSVSSSWKSTITSPQFMAKRDCGREMVIINDNPSFFDVRNTFCCPLSSITDNPIGNAASLLLVCPFHGPVKLEAFCDQQWCVLVKKSIYLWNPFTGACKKLPHSPPPQTNKRLLNRAVKEEVAYGLGYDDVEDDYKLLKLWRSEFCLRIRSFLYSSKEGVWREINGGYFPKSFPKSNALFVNGALNWISDHLVTFDFSTEKFRVLKQPTYFPHINSIKDVVDVAVLRSKLCVYVNYRRSYEETAFVLWVMEEYGVVESWTKLYEIRYESIPPIVSKFRRGAWFELRPLYLYEDGRVVISASCHGCKEWDIIVYKDMNVVAHSKIVSPSRTKVEPTTGNPSRRVRGGFVYGESFGSPIKLATSGS